MSRTTRDLGQKIRLARHEAGLSQRDLGKKLKVSDKTISSYEVGRNSPDFSHMRDISRAVGKPISYFDDEATPESLEQKLESIERELVQIKSLLREKKQKKK